ncbi:metal-dependent transcriptional regulator [Phytoactinopolyspora halotolerans]|uniref:Manganese transport regulator n=1 Tax=Phytoactinopolyspora halotolerans TaxID=1981512 RepID=A0A6L9S1S0_9ACTN|nr:metal-dependent transcriptional regulator [Phytoactinopolyspora halotolerans]NED99012.1 metal-dependent transcriptional regulator [Phytoactinopolyspora halotolerans]
MVVEHLGKVSVAAEDCVKVIYAAREWDDVAVTASYLKARLGVGAPAVSEMVRRLSEQGLVTHERYGPVALTEEGTALALRMLRRHRLVETYLVAELGYRWDEVHDEAEQLEHVVSDRLLDRMDERLGHPTRDPHGDPIPAADGTVRRPDAVPLSTLGVGDVGFVARISDDEPELLRYFTANEISLDQRIEVLRRRSYAGSSTLLVGAGDAASELELTDVAAAALWVTRPAAQPA